MIDYYNNILFGTGVQWVPELLDHHTEEWQRLAEEVKEEVYHYLFLHYV